MNQGERLDKAVDDAIERLKGIADCEHVWPKPRRETLQYRGACYRTTCRKCGLHVTRNTVAELNKALEAFK